MIKKSDKEISSVEEFITHMKRKDSMLLLNPIYRGQADIEWKLIPSLLRQKFIQRVGGLPDYEEHLLRKFKNLGLPYFTYQIQNEMDLMIVAQHHGLPTRLLDWTDNPLVALFFAVENLENKSDGVVYEMILNAVINKSDQDSLDNLKKLSILYPGHVSQRVHAQSGCFTIDGLPSDFKSIVCLKEVAKQSQLDHHIVEFYIPTNSKEKIKRQLDQIGINYFSLFPDLDGLAQQIKWEIACYKSLAPSYI